MLSKVDIAKLNKEGWLSFSSDSEGYTEEIGKSLGSVFKPDSMNLVQELTPRSTVEGNHTYSGNYGYGEFPLHTDLAHWNIPPRYFLLRCVSPDLLVGTKLLDGRKMIEDIGPDQFKRSLFKPRKRLGNTMCLVKLWDGVILRWDTLFLEPANKCGESLRNHVKEYLDSSEPTVQVMKDRGCCFLIDNWRMLHGRSSVSCKGVSARRLERVYLEEVFDAARED